MVKAEWGTKRTCPKCGTRFYDLGKEDPVTCVACGGAQGWGPSGLSMDSSLRWNDEIRKGPNGVARADRLP